MKHTKRRWGDKNHHWGPFTYSHERVYRPFAVVLSSGDDEDPGCCLRISAFGHTMICELPRILNPWRQWIDLKGRAWASGDGYWDVHTREYGVRVSDGFLQVFLGAQTHSSDTTQQWSKFLPWTQWRHVRYSLYGLDGEHIWTEPKRRGKQTSEEFHEQLKIREECPSLTFVFDDFDGERIEAKTRIEEREWLFGDGWFKWLSLFRRPLVRRSLNIEFSKETGRKKGSWKGGTVGHGIEMVGGELHESAFRRYCAEHEMKFIGMAA